MELTEGVLQQIGELGITIWHVCRRPVGQRHDDVAEAREGLVDALHFLGVIKASHEGAI